MSIHLLISYLYISNYHLHIYIYIYIHDLLRTYIHIVGVFAFAYSHSDQQMFWSVSLCLFWGDSGTLCGGVCSGYSSSNCNKWSCIQTGTNYGDCGRRDCPTQNDGINQHTHTDVQPKVTESINTHNDTSASASGVAMPRIQITRITRHCIKLILNSYFFIYTHIYIYVYMYITEITKHQSLERYMNRYI